MTREQFIEMAENFYKYANQQVEYKSLNLHASAKNQRKYNTKTATLVGVGVLGNAEHIILQAEFGGRIAIHYTNIKMPTAFMPYGSK